MFDLLLVALVGTVGLIAGLCVLAWIVYVPVAVRIFGDNAPTTAVTCQPVAAGEPCEFVNRDGALLRGTYLSTSARRRQGVVAFCHELGGDRYSGIQYARGLCDRGFDVFVFDFRCHGISQSVPGHRPMPWLTDFDLADVQAAIDYLDSRPDAHPAGIGLMGVSKGGAAALCAAAGDSRIRAVVTDGAFPTKQLQVHYIRRYMEVYSTAAARLYWLPDIALAALAAWTRLVASRRNSCRFVDIGAFASRMDQPVLMIHGNEDRFVPRDVARTLRSSLSGPSKLWLVSGAKHNGAVRAAGSEYHERVAGFFRTHLDRGSSYQLRGATLRVSRAAG